jgi:hypothetical protein
MINGKLQREGTLQALAERANLPMQAVSDLYDAEVAKLTATSRVKRFISVIAGRRVRQRLRRARELVK